jgi:glycine hydroxymethyltransferase
MLLSTAEHAKAIDKAVFPGLQGGPHNHTTAAIAVALKEASQPSFKDYAANVVANAQALADALLERGFDLVSGGTDNHLLLADLTNKGVTGKIAAKALDAAGIELNFNTVPFDPRRPFDPSGLRLGSAAITTRGLETGHMAAVAGWIERAVAAAARAGSREALAEPETARELDTIAGEVKDLLSGFPMPGWASED